MPERRSVRRRLGDEVAASKKLDVLVLAHANRRRAYLAANAFELLIGLLSLVTALTFFIDPSFLAQSPVSRQLQGTAWPLAWNTLYLVGGTAICFGLMWPKARIELVGLIFLSTAMLTNLLAIVNIAPSIGVLPSVLTIIAVILACYIRARTLISLGGARLTWRGYRR